MGSSVPPIEIGSLTAVSPNESQFIGSSSGIFFVNTVRRAFATSKVRTPRDESQAEDELDAETFIGGVDVDDHLRGIEHSGLQVSNNPTALPPNGTSGIYTGLLGESPSREHAGKLMQVYFRVWHPLFPFLHGPTFAKEVEDYYAEIENAHLVQDKSELRRRHCRAITFQCIFHLAALNRHDLRLRTRSTIKSVAALTTELCSLATRHDIPVLQALMAGQIYLIATMSLHAASTIGGVLLRLILHGGLHRCPCRYAQILSQDADIRKRIFWSAYAADRHLSQALGLPLGIQDSDIDVCIPGSAELHRPVQSRQSTRESATMEVSLHMPNASTPSQSGMSIAPSERSPHLMSPSVLSQPREKRPGEDALAHYVSYGRLTGRALEMLHKSLNVRTVQYSSVLELTSDIHSFWNSLPQHLQDIPSPSRDGDTYQSLLGLFFTINYQQLILLVNRPFLSLKPSTLEFRLSLQTCITASRTVISTLSGQGSGFQIVSWPGTLSVTWMSGLILAFACALELYPVEKGFSEITSCLKLLKEMSGASQTAKHCHSALKTLLDDLSSSHYGQNLDHFTTSLSANRKRAFSPSGDTPQSNDEIDNSKRQRSDNVTGNQASLNDDQNTAKNRSNTNEHAFNPALSDNTTTANNTGEDYGINNTAPFWFQQSGLNFGSGDQMAAYSHDIFGGLSCENLLQYDGDFEADFWNDNYFSGL